MPMEPAEAAQPDDEATTTTAAVVPDIEREAPPASDPVLQIATESAPDTEEPATQPAEATGLLLVDQPQAMELSITLDEGPTPEPAPALEPEPEPESAPALAPPVVAAPPIGAAAKLAAPPKLAMAPKLAPTLAAPAEAQAESRKRGLQEVAFYDRDITELVLFHITSLFDKKGRAEARKAANQAAKGSAPSPSKELETQLTVQKRDANAATSVKSRPSKPKKNRTPVLVAVLVVIGVIRIVTLLLPSSSAEAPVAYKAKPGESTSEAAARIAALEAAKGGITDKDGKQLSADQLKARTQQRLDAMQKLGVPGEKAGDQPPAAAKP